MKQVETIVRKNTRINNLYEIVSKKYLKTVPRIKKKLTKIKFLKYFFIHRKKISECNKKHNLLVFSWFGIKLKLMPDFKKKVDELFLKFIFPVTGYLPEILKNGWQFQILTIKEYNIIVYFEDFCRQMKSMEKEKHFSIKKFLLCEECFLRLIYNEEYPELLLKGLKKILLFYKRFFIKENVIEKLLDNLDAFFTPNRLNPSFYDLVLSFNMERYRRHFKLNEIMHHRFKEIVQNDFYSCSKEVFGVIISYIRVQLDKLHDMESELNHLNWLKSLSLIKKDKAPVKIIKFYEKLGFKWHKDQDNAFLLLILLIEGVIKELEQVILSEWYVMTDAEKLIYIKIIVSDELYGIYKEIENEVSYAKAKYTAKEPKQISLLQYLELKSNESKLYDGMQLFIYERIENIFSGLRNIAVNFNKIYEERFGKQRKLLNYMIVAPEEFRGKPIYCVLMYYIELILQICGYFQEKKLLLEFKKHRKLLQDIEVCKKKLKWTSDSKNLIIKVLESEEETEE